MRYRSGVARQGASVTAWLTGLVLPTAPGTEAVPAAGEGGRWWLPPDNPGPSWAVMDGTAGVRSRCRIRRQAGE